MNVTTLMDLQLYGPIYGYYIKYNRMTTLINSYFGGSDATVIDIFVDVHDIYRHALAFRNTRSDLPMANRLYIASGIINLCAHYREFFRSRYNTWSRFWLIDVESVDKHQMIYKPYDFKNSIVDNENLIADNNSILELICPYIPDVQFIKSNGFDLGVNVLDIVTKELSIGNDNPRLIISKDSYIDMISDSILNTFSVTPAKKVGQDESWMVSIFNSYADYIERTFKVKYDMGSGMISVLSALTKMPSRKIPSLKRADVVLKKLQALAIEENFQQHPHVWDIKQFIKEIGLDVDPYEAELRYRAIDIPIMYEAFKLDPASKLYNGMVNLYAPEDLKKINEKYFQAIPLDLEVL